MKIGSEKNVHVKAKVGRYIPEPRNKVADTFSNVLQGTIRTAAGAISSGAGINFDYAGLLQQQMQLQSEMQAISLESNVEKTKHETRMAPIRNTRVA